MCGLFGIINSHPKPINWQLVDTLGIANDSRGGDACGLFIDGKVSYGTDNLSLWYCWYKKDPLHKEAKNATILLGHCRKASIGGKDPDKAHPVCHYDENGNIDFVMVHNGTIRNYSELAAKYIPEYNAVGKSDTQVMANIFYNVGYDVLAEYQGAGVFVTVDYRTGVPVTRAFQGVSKEKWNDKEATPERPFYFTFDKGSYVFSSIGYFLEPFVPGNRFREQVLFALPDNTLCELSPTGIVPLAKYDRSEKCQSSYTGYQGGYSSQNPTFVGATAGTTGTTTTTTTATTTNKINGIAISSLIPSHPEYLTYNAINDTYYFGNNTAHGCYLLNTIGKRYTKPTKFTKEYYFWYGVILFNKKCFELLQSIMSQKNQTAEEFLRNNPDTVHYLSPYPWEDIKRVSDRLVINSIDWTNHPFSGKVVRIFDMFSRGYENGNCVSPEQFVGYLESSELFDSVVEITDIEDRLQRVNSSNLLKLIN